MPYSPWVFAQPMILRNTTVVFVLETEPLILLHAAGEQEDFRRLFLSGPSALVQWSGAVLRGLSQSNVRQNATVCIRGEPLSAGSAAGRGFQRRGPKFQPSPGAQPGHPTIFPPRLGEMLQDAGQPQAGGRAGRVFRPGPRLAIGTTRFCAAQHAFRGEGGPRRQAGPAARGQISPQATDIAINSSKETD